MSNPVYIAGLGSSAGGLDALTAFFENLKLSGSVSFIVVSHLPMERPTHLHTILSKVTTLPVHLLLESTFAQPNNIYVLPGHLRVKIVEGILLLRQREAYEVINTAIDDFLFSLAEDQKEMAISIIFPVWVRTGPWGLKK